MNKYISYSIWGALIFLTFYLTFFVTLFPESKYYCTTEEYNDLMNWTEKDCGHGVDFKDDFIKINDGQFGELAKQGWINKKYLSEINPEEMILEG